MKDSVHNVSTIRDYLRVIFKHKIIFLVMPVVLLIPTYLSLQMKTPMYEASVKMYVKAVKLMESDFYERLGGYNLIADHTVLIRSNIVLARVVMALKLYNIPVDEEKMYATPTKRIWIESSLAERNFRPEQLTQEQKINMAIAKLNSRISAISNREGSFLYINVKDFDGDRAVKIANSLSRSYVIFDLEQQLEELKLKYGEKHTLILQLTDFIAEMSKNLDGNVISEASALGPASVKIVEQAVGSGMEQAVNKPLLLITAFMASIVLSIIFSFLLEYYDHTIKSPDDIVTHLNVPFLCSIPERKLKDKLLNRGSSSSNTPYYKSIMKLAEQLHSIMKNKKHKSLLITGGENPKDMAVIIGNVGLHLARKSACKVLIIDANMRYSSSFAAIFDVPRTPGLVNCLYEKTPFEDVVQPIDSNLYFLPAGEKEINSLVSLDSAELTDLIAKARSVYELIIINTAPFNSYNDALTLSSITDCVALVINEGKIKRHVLRAALEPFEDKKIEMLGAILNKRKYIIPNFIYKIT